MEQKRRTITTANKVAKKKDRKKLWTIIGVILGFVVIFAVSYCITYGLITSDNGEEVSKTEVSSSAEDDIANMSRADLEKGYLKLKKQLEEKDEEIDMLKERLGQHEETSNDVAPSTTTTAPQSDNSSANETPASTPEQPPVTSQENTTSQQQPQTQQESQEQEESQGQEEQQPPIPTPPPASEFSNNELMLPGELDSLVSDTE